MYIESEMIGVKGLGKNRRTTSVEGTLLVRNIDIDTDIDKNIDIYI
jgi:hypothetical protein